MRARLLSGVLVVTVLAVAALFVPAARAIRSAHERGDLLALQREAAIVAARIPPTGDLDDVALRPIVDSSHRLGLYDSTGRLVSGVGPDPGDELVRTGTAGTFAESLVDDDLVAVVPLRLQDVGSSLVLRIEKPRAESAGRFRRSIAELGLITGGIIVLAAGVSIWLARRLNRPIEELRDWAAAPHGAGTDPDPPAPTGLGEIDALRDALIEGRAQVAELLRRERSFSSHVSHQLRTPVAAMRVAVETELASPRPDPAEALTELVEQLDRLESTVTSLLAVTRGNRAPVDCRLDEIVLERLRPWREQYSLAGRTLRAITPPTRVHADPDAIGHIVDVLVDNALRHGRGTVTVEIDPVGTTLAVADEGPAPLGRDVFEAGIGLRLARTLAETTSAELALLDTPATTFELAVTPAT